MFLLLRCRYAALFLLMLGSCSRERPFLAPPGDWTVEVVGSCSMFMGETLSRTPAGEISVVYAFTPAEHRDAEKVAALSRAGHPVLLRLRELQSEPPILISSVTDQGEAVIRCRDRAEADQIIARVEAAQVVWQGLTNR
jgi:hypothetical protein